MLGITAMAAALASGPLDVNLTVYSGMGGRGGGGFALVRETREVDLTEGEQEVRIEDVAQRIEPTSVGITSLSAPGSFSVLEQNYQYDLITPQAILNKAVGERIALRRVLPSGQVEITRGVLLSAPSTVVPNPGGGQTMFYGGLVLQADDGRIILSPEGTVEVESIPEGLISKPSLLWTLASSQAGPNRMQLTYLTGGMSWTAEYVLTLGSDAELGDLRGWVTLNNVSGTTYRDANLKLLAGTVRRATQFDAPGGFGGGGFAERAMASEAAFVQESFSEYHLYTMQRPTTIANNEMKQLSLLEGFDVPVQKQLVVDPLGNGFSRTYRPRNEPIGTGEFKPEVRFAFVNDEESNLGMPLPEGVFKVFQIDSSGSPQLLGEDRIGHTPRREEVEVTVGESFDVVVERTRTDFEWIGSPPYGIRETFEIEVRNRREEPTRVRLIERPSLEWSVTSATATWEQIHSNRIDFPVDVPADQTRTLTYTVETTWR